MDARAFEMFVGPLSTLTSRQMGKVVTLLDHESAQAKTAAVLEKAAAANLECPRCSSKKFYGHGEGWRWAVDADRTASPVTMLRAAIGVFPHLPVT